MLDLVADLVDGLVVVPVVGRVRGFSLRGDHVQPDVPFVANVARRWCLVREAVWRGRQPELYRVSVPCVRPPWGRGPTSSGQAVRADLDVQPGGLVLAGVQLGMVLLGSVLE